MKIDWNTRENLVLLNPRLPERDAARLSAALSSALEATPLQGHVFLLTSGTGARAQDPLSSFKWVALSKEALLSAAEAANHHLQCDSKDIWLHCLPGFHVGGLSIWARSSLSGARVVSSRCSQGWDPRLFANEALETRATLCSLVPTQVHDLVSLGARAPASLRAILLGGGAASEDLVSRARVLGWPVLPTYGMSETSSQVATTPLCGQGPLEVLRHLEVSCGPDQRLRIRGSSLLTGYIRPDADSSGRFENPLQQGWFQTDDFGEVNGRVLRVLGRISDRVKIGGETVHLARLEALLEQEASRLGIASRVTLVASPDSRLESVIHAVIEEGCDLDRARQAVERYNRQVLPFERARRTETVRAIPRTELGKIKRAELLALLASP